jgi:hypothetical protein
MRDSGQITVVLATTSLKSGTKANTIVVDPEPNGDPASAAYQLEVK